MRPSMKRSSIRCLMLVLAAAPCLAGDPIPIEPEEVSVPVPAPHIVDRPPLHGVLVEQLGVWRYQPDDGFWTLGTDTYTLIEPAGQTQTVRLIAKRHGGKSMPIVVSRDGPWTTVEAGGELDWIFGPELLGIVVGGGDAWLTFDETGWDWENAEHRIDFQGTGQNGGSGSGNMTFPPPSSASSDSEVTVLAAGSAEETLVRIWARTGHGSNLRVEVVGAPPGEWIPLPNLTHHLLIDWWTAAADLSVLTGFQVWVDDQRVHRTDDLADSGWALTEYHFGVMGSAGSDPPEIAIDNILITRGLAIPGLEYLLIDDFEGGDFGSWSAGETDDLELTAPAALAGDQGLEVLPGRRGDTYLADTSPTGEERCDVRFLLDPNSIYMAEEASFLLLGASDSDTALPGQDHLQLRLVRRDQRYELEARAIVGMTQTYLLPAVEIDDGPQAVELQWRAAFSQSVANGYLRLWIDGELVAELGGLDNYGKVVESLRLGAMQALGMVRGSFYLDAFESWRPVDMTP